MKRIELGCAGHFIASNKCRFRRHTQVGNYRISTVGDLYSRDDKRENLGAEPNSYFESMVFRTARPKVAGNEGCGCREVISWGELDSKRYATAGEAQAGHERLVAKYARLDRAGASQGWASCRTHGREYRDGCKACDVARLPKEPPPTSAERRAERIEEAARLVLRWRDSVYPPHGGLASDLAFLALILDENDAPAAPKEEA